MPGYSIEMKWLGSFCKICKFKVSTSVISQYHVVGRRLHLECQEELETPSLMGGALTLKKSTKAERRIKRSDLQCRIHRSIIDHRSSIIHPSSILNHLQSSCSKYHKKQRVSASLSSVLYNMIAMNTVKRSLEVSDTTIVECGTCNRQNTVRLSLFIIK
jgi:hypothetical protein